MSILTIPPITAATTSKLRMGNGVPTSSSGVQGGGCRTEPPRSKPSFPAPSTITPSESISVRGTASSISGQSRTSNDRIKEFAKASNRSSAPGPRPVAPGNIGVNQPASVRRPPVTTRQYQPSESWSIPTESVRQSAPSTRSGSTTYTPPASSASSQQRSVRPAPASSTARASGQSMSGAVQSTRNSTASRAMGGSSAGASQQNYVQPYSQDYARDYSSGLQQQPSGVSIGVPQSGNFHFHYNQVDNRKLTVNNNAPGHVTTNNNHVSNVDNSNHHNNNAPQGNTSTTRASDVGNTYTNVNQTANSARESASSSGYPYLHAGLPPSESLPIRDRQYKEKKKVTAGFWGGKPTVRYETVPDDRPC